MIEAEFCAKYPIEPLLFTYLCGRFGLIFPKTNVIMEQNAYLLERAVIEFERERTLKELSKRVPSIEPLDGRRITFFAVQARIDAHKDSTSRIAKNTQKAANCSICIAKNKKYLRISKKSSNFVRFLRAGTRSRPRSARRLRGSEFAGTLNKEKGGNKTKQNKSTK